MDSILGIMQKVAAREAEKLHTTELGVVTAVFPHTSDGDQDNYAVSVQLKNRPDPNGTPLELRKVPVSTQYIGWANIPKVGDLVVVQFVGGDLNAPIVTGRLYHDAERPPAKNDVGKAVLDGLETITITLKSGTKIEIDADGNVNIEAKGEVVINSGDKGAARKDDSVEVEIPAGSFIVAVAGQATGTPNSAPVKVQGKITSASEKVKIG
jgi:phage gp45-like